jgi:hypothetical protein
LVSCTKKIWQPYRPVSFFHFHALGLFPHKKTFSK